MSDDFAIRATALGKRYSIGSMRPHHGSIREQIVQRASGIFSSKARRERATEFWALRDVSFEIGRGENVGIIGLNGAGKSTLLKLLSRITQPSSGRALISGRVGALLEVGTGFHIELSGRDNVYLYGSILGMSRREIGRKFDAIVEFSGIEHHIDTVVKRYSSGMKVRLAFAVAAHLEPEILFLDEVLAVGDLSFQRKCMEFARSLQARDATIMFVSHNMFSIKTMCQRVIYLSGGKLRFDGAVDRGIALYEEECRLSVLNWSGAPAPEHWPIFVRSCEMMASDGQSRTIFEFDERIKIRLDYECRRPLTDPNIMVSIVRSDGVVVCTYSTELDGVKTGLIDSDGTIELHLPALKLVAEMYSVHVTVREFGFQQILCAQIGMSFHIRHALLDTHFGVFHEPAEWHLGIRQARTVASPAYLGSV